MKGIDEINNVNRLASNTKLEFGDTGLTLIYGENGSGKTGFSRLLRRTCTSRAVSTEILADVYSKSEGEAIAATFQVAIDGVWQSKKWTSEENTPLFPEVMFFDDECSRIEVSGKNEIVFVPPVLSFLNTFNTVLGQIEGRLRTYSSDLEKEANAGALPKEYATAPTAIKLVNADSVSEIETIIASIVSADEIKSKIRGINRSLESDPTKELAKAVNQQKQVNLFRDCVRSLYRCCIKESLDDRDRLLDARQNSRKAVELTAEKLFDVTALEGVGNEVWKTLWKAARNYSNELAYPNNRFPVLPDDAKCPLCQQPLTEEARGRFKTFEDFMMGATEKSFVDANKAVAAWEKRFHDSVNKLRESKSLIAFLSDDQLMLEATGLIEMLPKCDDADICCNYSDIGARALAVGNQLKSEDGLYTERIEKLKKVSDEQKRKQISQQLVDYKAQLWILDNKAALLTAFRAKTERGIIESAVKQCNTRPLSGLVNEVMDSEIVKVLASYFEKELRVLDVPNNHISLKASAVKGQGVQSVQLGEVNGSAVKASPAKVLSEGEQKIVALAGFFAGLDARKDSSSVVFDDPVTSLDHRWSKRIAYRLVEESKNRPVIVFTHDVSFAVLLMKAIEENKAELTQLTIQKQADTPGIVSSGLPWNALTTKNRISRLNQMSQEELRTAEKGTTEEYQKEITRCYSYLRSAWERAVEEILLGGVVERYSPVVHTQKLGEAIKASDYDIDVIKAAMTKCSSITEAHDDPCVSQPNLPSSDEFRKDVDTLDAWRKNYMKRQS